MFGKLSPFIPWSLWPESVNTGSWAWIHFVKSLFRLVRGESVCLEGSDPGRLFQWRLYSVFHVWSVHVWCHGTRVECSSVLTRGFVLNYSWFLPLSCLQSNLFHPGLFQQHYFHLVFSICRRQLALPSPCYCFSCFSIFVYSWIQALMPINPLGGCVATTINIIAMQRGTAEPT